MAANRRGPAVAGLLVLFAAGWGVGTIDAVLGLASPVEDSGDWVEDSGDEVEESGDEIEGSGGWVEAGDWLWALESITWQVTAAALLVWAAVMFAGTHGVGRRQLGLSLPRTRENWRAEAGVFGADVLVSVAAFRVMDLVDGLLGVPPYGSDGYEPVAPEIADGLVASALAGPTEEVVLLAVTVSVLRRAGFSWCAVVLFAVALRLSFHLYYGVGTAALVIWAAGMVVVYARTGRILGVVVSHALWNVTRDVDHLTGLPVPVLFWSLQVAALVFLVLAWRAGVFTGRPERHLPPPPGAAGRPAAGALVPQPAGRVDAAPPAGGSAPADVAPAGDCTRPGR
ncbi:CAAX prenyl protease-like protein [Kineococcus xinjiangensis]|uniref:CAAX prenyl protease-like protein n=1 Tax=Kineococcus xinjiangensis TaxID=512762 RepID=A0A2S6IG55_9ACTN|nr:CPBP family intramembrane glutamic endopeptidase [Kineococcus xinjiangensis]PPK93204.1 CAAX prenyl protease-like protein [Kineococcus xinjiangensis]